MVHININKFNVIYIYEILPAQINEIPNNLQIICICIYKATLHILCYIKCNVYLDKAYTQTHVYPHCICIQSI